MSDTDRRKWDQRYREDSYQKGLPAELLLDWAPRVEPGRALDVACGAGRNAIYLAARGFTVDAVDISAEGLRLARAAAAAEGLEINWMEQDLDRGLAVAGDYRLIVVLWYVDLALLGRLGERLEPGGYLVSEQHLRTDAEVIGPRTAEFRVAPGALAAAAGNLETLHYRESVYPVGEDERIASAQLVARRG